jgi:hypothetical protein
MEKIEHNPDDSAEKNAAYALQFDWSTNGKSTVVNQLYFKPPVLTA